MPSLLIEDPAPGVRSLVLNRPQARNAIDHPLRVALRDALLEAAADPGVDALLISGAEGHFCAGGDIGSMEGLTEESARARMTYVAEGAMAFAACRKPILAAVEGHAAGAGVGVCLLADEVIADPGAQFTFAFSRIGLGPDWGISLTLPARVGRARAQRLLLDGARLSAEEALALGLIDGISAHGAAKVEALSRAAEIAQKAQPAVQGILRHMRHAPSALRAALDREIEVQVRCMTAPEFREGIAAFREKRPADFRKARKT